VAETKKPTNAATKKRRKRSHTEHAPLAINSVPDAPIIPLHPAHYNTKTTASTIPIALRCVQNVLIFRLLLKITVCASR
jgi:hypothetical protein